MARACRTRKPGPRIKRGDTHLHGVYYRPANNADYPFVAWLCHKGIVIHIGTFASGIQAAHVADFARYMLFGLDYEEWPIDPKRHRKPNPPNFPPVAKLQMPKGLASLILRKLNRHGWLDSETWFFRLRLYFQIATEHVQAST